MLKVVVDMKSMDVSVEPIDDKYKELGGRALVAQYVMDHVPPTCDPLGEDNTLIFCTTMFAGTKLTTAHRLSVGGKSPLTGGIKESNVGGYAASLLAEQGVKMIVVKNKPTNGSWKFLQFDAKGKVSLMDATDYIGVNNYELNEKIADKLNNKFAAITIGSAGERQYKSASIQVSEFGTGYPSRSAARGGLGALMGSKGLKGIIIEKPEKRVKMTYADEEMFDKACLQLNKMIMEGVKKDPFHNIGTISTIEVTATNGILPVGNFSGEFFQNYESVGATTFMNNLKSRGGKNKCACQPGCVVQCSNIYNDDEGNYLTSGFEYETVAMLGPNCRIGDLDIIAQMDRICDDIGVDSIEAGNAIAMCMEAGKIEWGDGNAALQLMEEMKEGTSFGRILGNGCEEAGKHLSVERIPVVKHQSISGYDPRNTKGTGVTYATSPMGADHTAGLTMGRAFEDTGRAAQAYVSNKLQVAMCFADSMMCIFAFAHSVPGLPLYGKLLAGLHGGDDHVSRIAMMGVKTLLTERAFNRMAGMTDEDDRLPRFFYEERSEVTGSRFDIHDVELEALFDF